MLSLLLSARNEKSFFYFFSSLSLFSRSLPFQFDIYFWAFRTNSKASHWKSLLAFCHAQHKSKCGMKMKRMELVSVAFFKCLNFQWLSPFRELSVFELFNTCDWDRCGWFVVAKIRWLCHICCVLSDDLQFWILWMFKPLFEINFRFGHWSQNIAYHKSVYSQHRTHAHCIHSHRWRWIMYFTWAHRISIYI